MIKGDSKIYKACCPPKPSFNGGCNSHCCSQYFCMSQCHQCGVCYNCPEHGMDLVDFVSNYLYVPSDPGPVTSSVVQHYQEIMQALVSGRYVQVVRLRQGVYSQPRSLFSSRGYVVAYDCVYSESHKCANKYRLYGLSNPQLDTSSGVLLAEWDAKPMTEREWKSWESYLNGQ